MFSVPVDSGKALEPQRKLNDFLGATNVKRVFASFANQPEGGMWSVLFFYDETGQMTPKTATAPLASANASSNPSTETGTPLTGDQVKMMIALKKWRADQAATEGVPLYMVAQNRWLEDIVRMPAKTVDDLMKVRGLGDWRAQKYGAKILETLNATNASRRSWPSSSYSAGRA
jgi:superfamily II DNA helicase RecQ